MRSARDNLIVGLLLIVVVLEAYNLLVVAPARTSTPLPSPSMAAAAPTEEASPSASAAESPVVGTPSATPQAQAGGPLHMREYLAGLAALEADPRVALTPAQASALLPYLRKYHEAYDAVPQAQAGILEALNATQRAWLVKHVPRRPPVADPSRSAEVILVEKSEAVRKALEPR